MKANFLWATITVKSIEVSLPFYQNLLGLSIERRFKPHPGLELCFLRDANGIEIELLEHIDTERTTEAKPSLGSGNLSLGFKVDNLQKMLEICLANNVQVTAGPFEGAGVKFFFVKDPDDITIQFVQN